MANISIPNLPSQTATTELDLLVITDSGETTTSKITKAVFLDGIGGGNLIAGGGTDSYTTTGNEAQVSGTNNLLLTANRAYSNSGTIGGSRNTILANGTNINNGSIIGNDCLLGGGSFFENSTRTASGTRQTLLSNQYMKNIPGNNVFVAATSRADSAGAQSSAMIASFNPRIGTGTGVVIIGGDGNVINGSGSASIIAGGAEHLDNSSTSINNVRANGMFAGYNNEHNTNAWAAAILGGQNHINSATRGGIIGGSNNTLNSTAANSVILGGISILGTQTNTAYVPQLVIAQYASLDFATDAAAATGGVELGGVYHNAGALRVRIA